MKSAKARRFKVISFEVVGAPFTLGVVKGAYVLYENVDFAELAKKPMRLGVSGRWLRPAAVRRSPRKHL